MTNQPVSTMVSIHVMVAVDFLRELHADQIPGYVKVMVPAMWIRIAGMNAKLAELINASELV